VKTGIQRILTTWKYWIPAGVYPVLCYGAGMTDNGLFRLFTIPSFLETLKLTFLKIFRAHHFLILTIGRIFDFIY
jgi:hypothetical protein